MMLVPNILIVEDENIVALDIEHGLKRLGYNSLGSVNNGITALEKVAQYKPHLVLMDIQIKGPIDGIETAIRIRDTYNIPVIFLTAHADEATLQRAKAADPYGYLLKPFEETELHTVIQVALKKYNLVEEQRKVSEKKIHDTEERFEILINSLRDYAICILDLEGHIISWNEGAERIFGYDRDEIVGSHYAIFATDDDISSRLPFWTLNETKNHGTFEDEGWRLRKDHTTFWARVTLTKLSDKNNSHIGYAMITRDLTERKRAEDRLRLANEGLESRVQERTAKLSEALQIRDEFLSIASHELKNPLATLCLQIHLLTKHIQDFRGLKEISSVSMLEKLVKSVDCCEAQSKRLVSMIDQLLDLTSIRIGRLELRKELVDISELIQQAISHQKNAEIKTIEINFAAPPEPIIGKWDPARLEQIILNLISNAVKYGNKTPIDVLLSCDNEKKLVQISVKDRGPGIPLDLQEKIFEKFQRAPSALAVTGLGLGLYIVKQIIKAHGGQIYVHSLPGEGSTFIVDLPLGVGTPLSLNPPKTESPVKDEEAVYKDNNLAN